MGDEEAPAEAEVDTGPVCSPIVLEACMKGADSKVKGYYEKNPDDKEKINELVSKQYGWTPLQVACGYGHAKVVSALLELGAKAGVPDKMGMTAMHSAADSDEKACMEALLETEDGKAAVNTADSVRIRIWSRTFAHTHALARVQQPFFSRVADATLSPPLSFVPTGGGHPAALRRLLEPRGDCHHASARGCDDGRCRR